MVSYVFVGYDDYSVLQLCVDGTGEAGLVNWKLVLMPEEILDYVVVHVLAHRLQMNHSTEFWDEVEKILPDYRKRRQWLKENGQKY